MGVLFAVILALVALIITPGYLYYFDVTPKLTVLLAGTAAVALAACWENTRQAEPPSRRWGRRFRLPVDSRILYVFGALLLLNILSLAASTVLSSNPALSLFGTNWRRFGAAAQVAVLLFAWLIARHTAGRPERLRLILRGVAVAGLGVSSYGIAQYLGWDPLLPASAYHVGEGIWTIVRPPGTLGYASYFAAWLSVAVFLSLASVKLEVNLIWRSTAFAAAGLSAVALVLTGTRAAFLGLLAGAVIWLCWRARPYWRRAAVFAVVALVAVAGLYESPVGWKLKSRARWFAEDPWGGARPVLWRDSTRMAFERPAAGYGPEVFTAEFPRYESKQLARAYPDFAHESPHNIFLDSLVAQGIPGLLILLGLCGVGLAAAWRGRLKNVPSVPGLTAALAAGIVSQQFTVFTLPNALMFYTTIALAAGLVSPSAESRRSPAWVAGAIAAAALLMYVAVRYTSADHALALARRGLEAGNVPAAAAHYRDYQRWRFPGASADLWYSRATAVAAQTARDPVMGLEAQAQSGATALSATRTVEDPFNAWYSLAAICASRNDAACVENSLRAAIAANPNWFKPHWTLAQVLRLNNRIAEAEREAALAVDLNGAKNPEVASTLGEIRALRTQSPEAFAIVNTR